MKPRDFLFLVWKKRFLRKKIVDEATFCLSLSAGWLREVASLVGRSSDPRRETFSYRRAGKDKNKMARISLGTWLLFYFKKQPSLACEMLRRKRWSGRRKRSPVKRGETDNPFDIGNSHNLTPWHNSNKVKRWQKREEEKEPKMRNS